MSAIKLDGTAVARAIRDEVAAGVSTLGRAPGLTVVLVGESPASVVYVRGKEKAAREAGMRSEVLRLPGSASEREVLAAVARLNADPDVHGILVQLPLPAGIDAQRVLEGIDPAKDVDGFHPENAGRLLIGLPGFVPCTPAGIVELLKRHDVPLAGKHAVVLGRSNIVGKPMAILLLRENCTVTVCHSQTPDLRTIAAQADLLVAAIGKPGFVGGGFVKPGAAVVDVGIHTLTDEAAVRAVFGNDEAKLRLLREKGSVLGGDVRPHEAAERAGWLSPVPGGVGPLTIAMLLKNTLDAARRCYASV
ncbi:MAG TPA: bifunctional 5,10-methylenetetrahydrofolate dehydrogenase/5,10-methenyltetrahydrofolate cyclohydrolase [Candidatus Polarisedimenticolaceae bacterium]|nr:bifunctional 5,10-methylenetetrahydrofolate dehydrogenase/5,10-methenyltetrahydrofolate cyclohydrolase [Candidatus Polarisedimenticolaceae bacterium]